MAKVILKVKKGDPIKGTLEEKAIYSPGRSKAALQFDVRDRLSELVGKGNALHPDDRASIYSNLVTALGDQKARKVMEHAYLFNQRPDVQGMPTEDKIRAFYAIGSNDPDVKGLIDQSKSLGYGALQGFRSSSSALNQRLAGRVPETTTDISPEIKQRVVLRTGK